MKATYCQVFIVLLLASCSSAPSGNAVQTAISQTQIALPTNTLIPSPTVTITLESTSTPTPIPLGKIDLESILLLPGDLPTDIVGGQIKSNPPNGLGSLPKSDQVISTGFRSGELASDGVTIFLFDAISDVDNAYNVIAQNKSITSSLPDVGEKAVIKVENLSSVPLIGGGSIAGGKSVQLLFSRCHALVYIDLFAESVNSEVATTYAQRIDKRLTPLVCR